MTRVAPQSDEELIAELREMFRLENHGIKRVERLAGNIGIIEFTVIPDAAAAGDAIAAAFELVQHTYGLILDLRGCRGGAPDGEAYVCSFLFAGQRGASAAMSSKGRRARRISSGPPAICPRRATWTGRCRCS